MVNDTTTLNGALQELGETMAANLVTKGVQASASDGLTTLAGKILDISGGGGSCYHIEFSEASYTAVGGSATLEIFLQENYAPKSGATVTVSGSDSSSYTGLTNNDGIAQVTVSNISGTVSFTCSYSNVSAQCTVVGSSVIWEDDFSTGLSSNWVSVGKNGSVSVSNNQLNVSCSTDGGRAGAYYNQIVTGSYKVTVDLASASYDSYAFGLQLNTNNWTYYESQPKWSACFQTVPNTGGRATQSNESRTSGVSYTTATLVFEIVQDTSIKTYVNGSLKQTYTCSNGTTDGYVGIVQCCSRTTKINSIKVEAL